MAFSSTDIFLETRQAVTVCQCTELLKALWEQYRISLQDRKLEHTKKEKKRKYNLFINLQ